MNTSLPVEVLLATYNGERYLAAQLDSLLDQTMSDFVIVVSDGGSRDDTLSVLKDYAERHPGRFQILPQVSRRLDANANFARLLDAASADYVFFCDQDDVWAPDKMTMSLAHLKAIQAAEPGGTAILLHTDLRVVGADLRVLGRSFFDYVGSNPGRHSLGQLLLGNIVTGCTVLVNRPLYELARPIPAEAPMFDHWLGLVAAGVGKIGYIDRAMVDYRQHGGNLIGATKAGAASLLQRARRILSGNSTLKVLERYCAQARVMLDRYASQLSPSDRRKLRAMAGLWQRPKLLRLASLYRAGLFKPTLATNLGLVCLLLRNGKAMGQTGSSATTVLLATSLDA